MHYTPRQIYRRQTRVKKKADGREGRYQKLHLETLLFYFTPQEHKRMTQRADMLVGSDEQMNWVGGDSTLTLGGLVYTPAMRCGLYCPAAGKPVWSSYQPNHTYFSCRYHRAVPSHPNWHHVVQIPTIGAHLFLGALLTLIILLFDLSPPPPPLLHQPPLSATLSAQVHPLQAHLRLDNRPLLAVLLHLERSLLQLSHLSLLFSHLPQQTQA